MKFSRSNIMCAFRMTLLSLLCVMLLAPPAVRAASPKIGYGFNKTIYAVATGSDGTAYLGGDFTSAGLDTGVGAALDATSGLAGRTFPRVTFPYVTPTVKAVVADGSGGWYIGGYFSTVGNVARNNLAHILSTGDVDPSWNPSANGKVNALILSGTTLYVGGEFTTVCGSSRNHLAAIGTDGTLASWNPSANGFVNSLAISGSTIYAGGAFTVMGTSSRKNLAAIGTDGSLASWNPSADGFVYSLAISGATVYVGGDFAFIGTSLRNYLAAIGTDGTLASWNPSSNGTVNALAISGSTVYAGGTFTSMGTSTRNYLAAIGTNGALASWNPNASQSVYSLAISGSTVYAGGTFTSMGTSSRNFLAAIGTNGTVASWNPNVNNTVYALAVSGTTVYAGGAFTLVNQAPRNKLAAIGADGDLTNWDPNANSSVRALAIVGSTVYVGGGFTTMGGSTRNRAAAIGTNGTLLSWNPNAGNSVNALAISGSIVYLGGDFSTVGGSTRNYLAAVDAAGVLTTWDPNADGTVNALAITESMVYAGGNFTTIGTTGRKHLAAIGTNGTLSNWNPSPNNGVFALAISGSTVYAGGSFSTIGTSTRSRLAAIGTDGTLKSWNPAANDLVAALAISGSTVYAGGNFSLIGTSGRNRLAAIGMDGTLLSWNPGANSSVLALAASTTRMYVGGAFTSIAASLGAPLSASCFSLMLPYYALPAPTVTSISPTAGLMVGGAGVTISGANFQSGATVTIGGVAATNVTVVSSTLITATTPAGIAGAQEVVVTTPDTQTVALANGFTYKSDNASLSNLLVQNTSALTLTPVFASATTSYSVAVAATVSNVTVTPTLADTTASVTVNGQAITLASPSAQVSLVPGVNSIPVVVPAQDGVTVKTYTLSVTRAGVDGGGTLTVSPQVATAAATGQTFSFTYTAATGGMGGGEIDITISSLGTVGSVTSSVTSSVGAASLANGVIKVTGVTLAGGESATITWSKATVVATIGSKTVSATQKAIAGGTLKALTASPSVTVGKAPGATTAAAANVTGVTATLNGTVVDNGAATAVTFEYGLTTGYGTSVTATTNGSIAANAGSKAAAVSLTGLNCGGITYNYRVVATNSTGTTNGANLTFKTDTACPPVITAPTVSAAASMATFTFQSDTAGTGYFTLLPGASATCGSATQTKAGQDAAGKAAFRFGSLPLIANTPASYTIRNLLALTAYTVCFSADKIGTLATPAGAGFTTAYAAGYEQPEWHTVGSAGFSADRSEYTSLSFASDGAPFVAYKDDGNGGKATVMKYDGSAWVTVGSAGFSAGAAMYTSLSFAPDGSPFVAYKDGANGGKATVMKYNGSAWVTVGSAGFSAGAAMNTSLSFAPDGSPFVAYEDGGNSSKATVMKYDAANSKWVVVGSAGFSADMASYTSLSFAPDGAPYVAYQDESNSGKITVMKYDAATAKWVTVGSAGFSASYANCISLFFKPDGVPYVAYQDSGNSAKATVMKYDAANSKWIAVGSAGFSASDAIDTSLSFAPDGTPFVAYLDGGQNSKATVMNYYGSTWFTVGRAGFSSGSAANISVSFAPDGTPFVAFKDGGNNYKVTVMRLGESLSAPTVSTYGATDITATSATLTGTFNANGAATTVSFEYGSGAPYTVVAAGQSPLAATAINATASAVITGLTCNTQYSFRPLAVNSIGAINASYSTFTTTACPPTAATGAATVKSGGTTLNGTVSANGGAATVTFEYGATASYGDAVSAGQSPLAGSARNAAVSATITGLTCGSVYHYRAGAGNSAGTSYGSDATFIIPCAPTLTAPTVAAVGTGMATITLQSGGTGTGYLTLLAGNNALCGSAAQTATGLTAANSAALQHGSLPLVANTQGRYTMRTLAAATPYTVCFTADQGGDAATPLALNLTTTAMATYSSPAWEQVGATEFSAGGVVSVSQAMAADGAPYVAYSDYANGYKATVMKYDGTAWVAVGTSGFTSSQVFETRLTIAPDGTPYIAFRDYSGGNGGKTTVMKFTGTAWTTVGTTGFSKGTPNSISFSIAPDGAPWLAYSDSLTTVMKFDGAAWVAVGGSIPAKDSNSLLFAPDGTPWIAFTDNSADAGNVVSYKASVKKYDGTAWVTVGPSKFSASSAYQLSLAFTPDGTPFVAYRDNGNSGRTTIMSFNGAAWNQVGVTGATGGETDSFSLAVGPDGTPYVAVTDATNGNKATVVRYNGSAWMSVGSAGFSSNLIGYPSLAFSLDGTPYLASALGNSYIYSSGAATALRLTNGVSAPSATTGAATTVTATGVMLGGMINPNGADTTVSFDYGATTAYGVNLAATTGGTVPVGSGDTTVGVTLSGLSCGTLYHYRVTAVNSAGAVNGNDATFTTSACPVPPSIGAQPVNVTVNSGGSTSFTVNATGSLLTYQWQVNSGSGFGDISNGGVYGGATTATLAISGVTAAMNGSSYRVVVSGSGTPAATSGSALLTVNTEPIITTQPLSVRIKQLTAASFTVAATGYGTLSYQWQVSTDSGATFGAVTNGTVPGKVGATYSGAATATLGIAGAPYGMNDYRYRVIVTGGVSPAATSNSATLTVLLADLPITSGTWPTTSTTPAGYWSTPGGNASKNGATLTLTPNSTNQAGYIFYTEAFAATQGINVTFDYFSSNGNGGDGMSFFLIDGSYSPAAAGGALGYGSAVNSGVAGGWLGIGLDEYGNFSNGNGGPGLSAQSVALRGKATNYSYITKGKPTFTIDGGNRKVNLTVDRSQNTTVRISNDSGATWQTVINNYSLGQTAPETFKLGFGANTGQSTNLHTVSNVKVVVPMDDSLTGSGLPAGAGAGSAVSFTLHVCPQSTASYATDTKAMVTVTPTKITLAQTSFGPYDLSGGSCVDIPLSGTVTATSGQSYSYSAAVTSNDTTLGDMNPANNSATQSGTAVAAPTVTSGAAGGVTATGATLNGTVNANSVSTTTSFDYGATVSYGLSVAANPFTVTGSNATAISALLSGLSCNTTYHFRAKGVSSGGTINGSDALFTTTACVPGAPAIDSVTAGDKQAVVTFTAPAGNGGAAITGYTVTSSPGGKTASGSSGQLSLTVTGLTNGTPYSFKVTAGNSVGIGASSTASATVTPKAAQTIGAISFNPASLVVGGATMASAVATSGLDVSFSTSTPGICSVNGRAVAAKATGVCTVTADQSGGDSWNAAPEVTQNITVTKAAQTITFTNPTVSKTYGAADFGPGASASSGLAVTYSSSNSEYVATVTGDGLVHIVGAGSVTITASQAGDAAYAAATGTMTLNVEKAPLDVIADNKSRAYGADNPVLTVSYSEFVKGENASVISGVPAVSTDAVNSSPPGSYLITLNIGSLYAANYRFASVAPGTLAIDLGLKNITFNPLPDKTYGETPFSVTATGGADGIPITYASSNTAVATVDGSTVTVIGAGNTVITASQAESPNSAATSARQTLTVTKAPLMVTAESYERFYGEPDPFFTVTYSGFVNGQDTTVLSGASVITTTATGGSPTGAYPITPAQGTLAAANYEIFFAPGTLAVDLALQNVSFAGIATRTYGEASYDPGATGRGSGNPLIYSSSNPAVASVSGSAITITGAGRTIITVSQAGNDYYAPAQAQQILTVAPKSLTVSADNKDRTYGESNPALTVSYSGFAGGDDATKLSGAPVVNTTADSSSSAGSYPITIAAGNLFSANYTFAYVDGVLTVGKAPATVTLDAASLSRSYDGTAQAATATTNPTGLTVVFSYVDRNGNPVESPTGAGSYTVNAAINNSAYSGSIGGVLTIAKANQTVSFASPAAARTYGGADFGPGAVASSGLAVTYGSDNATVATVTAGGLFHIVGAGAATITATQAGSDNYNPAFATLPLTVAKAALAVSADNNSRAAGIANPVFTATYSGFINGESVSVLSGAPLLTTTAGNASPTGSYPITPAAGTLAAANYSFSFVPGTLAVGMGSQNVIFNPLEAKMYGDAPFDLTATGGGSGNPVTFSSSNPAVATVNGATVTIVGAGETVITANQSGSASFAEGTALRTLTVAKAPLVVTADSVERIYTTPNPTFTASCTGFVNGEEQSVLSGAPVITTTATSASPVGSYPITTAPGTLASANYSFNFAPGTLAVDLALQTITFNQMTVRNYGDAPFDPGATGDASGNPVTYASSDPAVATVSGSIVTITGVGQAVITAYQEGNYNYASATAARVLTVKPARLMVTADNQNRVYSTANPTLTVTYSGFAAGDDQTRLTGAPALTTSADTESPAGSYPITAAAGNLFATNYTFTYQDGILTVDKATPVITWSNPAVIRHGTALSATQLNATADVAGTFAYTPDLGAIPGVGAGQLLTATFTPNDATSYATATRSVTIDVIQIMPVITWSNPAAIRYGTALSSTQLNATADVAGTFAYTPGFSTVLGVGAGQVLSVTFTPGDATSYTTATRSVSIDVNSGAPQTITFAPLTPKALGSAFTLTATATSGLAVTFAGSDSSVASISGTAVTFHKAGVVTITASQTGDGVWLAAPDVNRTLTVTSFGKPTLALSTLANGAVTRESVLNLSGSAAGGNGAITSLTLNGAPQTLDSDNTFSAAYLLVPGANLLTTMATDAASQTAIDSRTVTLDATAPGLTVTAPIDNSSVTDPILTVAGSVTDAGSLVDVALNGETFVTLQYDLNFNLGVYLRDGVNTIQVTATNQGKSASVARTITYTPSTPGLAVTAPDADTVTDQANLSLTGTVDFPNAVTVTVICDGQSYTPAVAAGAFSQPLTFTDAKTYAIVVTAVDGAGNSTTVRRNIIYQPTRTVTIASTPTGRTLLIDNVSVITPRTYTWSVGSKHTIAVAATTQDDAAGTRYIFSSWSDVGADGHEITVPATAATYTAGFGTQYQLTMVAGSGGTVLPASGNWYNAGMTPNIIATAGSGYAFTTWSLTSGTGPFLNPTGSSTTVAMNGPNSVTAAFQAKTVSLSAAISVATGTTGSLRTWPVIFTNTGGATVNSVQLTGVTLSSSGTCKPTATTVFPVSLGDIAAGKSATGSVSVDFSTCNTPKLKALKFSVSIGYSANGGSAYGTLGMSGVGQ